MSRIYEALQRAELDRKGTPDLADEPLVATATATEPVQHVAPNEFDPNRVARYAWRPNVTSLPTLAERGEAVEQFRSLRSHIYQLRYQAALKTIIVSSGTPSEGKSFVTANLAVSLARNNERNVLLIDGDLRRPTVHKLFGAPNNSGLSEFLSGTAEISEVMQRNTEVGPSEVQGVRDLSNLTLITAGVSGENSLELVGNHRIEALVEAATPHFDWILIDSPPVLAVTDAVDLARAADGVLLVARGTSTPYDIAQRAAQAFSNARLLGFVLNAVKDAPKGGYYYNYYGYHDSNDPKRRKDKRR
jgi:capsular exopolysaccharide synthesis family protein